MTNDSAPWWGPPLGVSVVGMFVVGFFIFPTVTMGAFFSLFGLLFLGVGVCLCVSTLQFVRGAIPADGIVVGFEERLEEEEGERSVSFFPRVEFETQDHEKRVFTSDDGSRKASYRVGEPVRVLYDPARPQVARINKHLWGPIVVTVVIGTCFLVPGLRILLVGIHVLPGEIHWE